jgi:26S proteasome regulatory subunit T5
MPFFKIHARKMTVDAAVNFEEIARSTEDFNGAQLKAVCVEAVRSILASQHCFLQRTVPPFSAHSHILQGMLAMRRDATTVNHEDFVEGVAQVQAKKKGNLQYYL